MIISAYVSKNVNFSGFNEQYTLLNLKNTKFYWTILGASTFAAK